MSFSSSAITSVTGPISLPSLPTTGQPVLDHHPRDRIGHGQTVLPPMYQTGPCVPTGIVSESTRRRRSSPRMPSSSQRSRQRRIMPGERRSRTCARSGTGARRRARVAARVQRRHQQRAARRRGRSSAARPRRSRSLQSGGSDAVERVPAVGERRRVGRRGGRAAGAGGRVGSALLATSSSAPSMPSASSRASTAPHALRRRRAAPPRRRRSETSVPGRDGPSEPSSAAPRARRRLVGKREPSRASPHLVQPRVDACPTARRAPSRRSITRVSGSASLHWRRGEGREADARALGRPSCATSCARCC